MLTRYKYNCEKLENFRNIFDAIDNKYSYAYINKYYDMPLPDLLKDIIFFGDIFNNNDYSKLSEYDILDPIKRLNLDFKKHDYIPIYEYKDKSYICYNLKTDKYERTYIFSNNSRDAIEVDINDIVELNKLKELHEEYDNRSKAIYDKIIVNPIVKKNISSKYIIFPFKKYPLSFEKEYKRCGDIWNAVLGIIIGISTKKDYISTIITQKLLFGILDIADIHPKAFTVFMRNIKQQMENTNK